MEGGPAADAHAKDASTISKGQKDREDAIEDGVVNTKDASIEIQEPAVQTTEALLAQLIGEQSQSLAYSCVTHLKVQALFPSLTSSYETSRNTTSDKKSSKQRMRRRKRRGMKSRRGRW